MNSIKNGKENSDKEIPFFLFLTEKGELFSIKYLCDMIYKFLIDLKEVILQDNNSLQIYLNWRMSKVIK